MQLEQRDKELAAIGSSIGCNAAEHEASVHGNPDTPELREKIRSMLKDEAAPSHE